MNRAKTQPAIGAEDELAVGDSDFAAPGPLLTGPAEARLTFVVERASDGGAPTGGAEPSARNTNSQSSCLGFCSSTPAPFSPVGLSSLEGGASAMVRSNTRTC